MTMIVQHFRHRMLALALLMGLGLILPAAAQTQRDTLVEVDVAAMEHIAPTSRIYARIVTHPPAAVLASVDAVMTMADLKIGKFVKKGELIATQDDRDLRLKLELYRLNLDMISQRIAQLNDQIRQESRVRDLLEKQVTLLMGRAERLSQLMSNQVIKRDQFEAVEIQLLTAQRQYAESTGRIMKLETDLSLEQIKRRQTEVEKDEISADLKETEIRAPVAGQLIEVPASRQRFMREGDVLARILSGDDYEIEADIPVGVLAYLRGRENIAGMDAEGQPVTTRFRVELPEENQKTATRPVRFDITSPLTSAMMADGARLQLDIPKGSPRPAITVPVDAIISDQGQAIVFVAQEGVASRRIVQLGTATGARVEISGGLAEGEAVIVKGNENLRNGAKIKIVNGK
ncbi:efflux RND transporter periplasmic adaptor subunit [Alphaproteobacteria bacterium LSUCC0684]